MELIRKGKYFDLLLSGYTISKIIYDGFISLEFNIKDKTILDFHGEFRLIKFNQSKMLHPNSKETYLNFYDLYGEIIKEGLADKYGNLYMVFENKTEIHVLDGPFENWHFTKHFGQTNERRINVHGGCGKTSF